MRTFSLLVEAPRMREYKYNYVMRYKTLCSDVRLPSAMARKFLFRLSVLRHPVGTPAHGAVGLQSLVPLVRGLSPDDPIWDPTTFTKNRDRLQTGAVFAKFMSKLLNHPEVKPLLSDEHFSVDGTLIEAWASCKSSAPRTAVATTTAGPTSTASSAKTTRCEH